MPTKSKNFRQEINRQVFGCNRRPVKHVGKRLLRGAINTTNDLFGDLISAFSGGKGNKKGKRRRRRRY